MLEVFCFRVAWMFELRGKAESNRESDKNVGVCSPQGTTWKSRQAVGGARRLALLPTLVTVGAPASCCMQKVGSRRRLAQ